VLRRFAIGAGVLGVALAGGLLALALPVPEHTAPALAPIDAGEHARTVAALAPRRSPPVVAVLGQYDGTETTDFLVPYGVLRESGVADVVAVATRPGPLALHPALTIRPQATTAEFDGRHPDGADYVIVPALHHADDPDVLAWLRAQAAKKATIVGVCDGALVLAAAGLLDDRQATAHWYSRDALRKRHPGMQWVRDRRYVVDRGVVTTTGITASIPVSLTLVEAIAGRSAAEGLARRLGVERWDAAHDSDAYHLDRRHVRTAAGNWLAFWSHETLALPVEDGVDEIGLALAADAWSRTYRSRVLATAAAPVTTRRGLVLVPDADAAADVTLPPVGGDQPARAVDRTLRDMAERYGEPTAAFVALQLEYPWR
jgi:transcriptional regulator GlxA family with amidase domain